MMSASCGTGNVRTLKNNTLSFIQAMYDLNKRENLRHIQDNRCVHLYKRIWMNNLKRKGGEIREFYQLGREEILKGKTTSLARFQKENSTSTNCKKQRCSAGRVNMNIEIFDWLYLNDGIV
jgi:hypothetical protein